jgi:DNA replication and repair protein RecF
VLAKLSPDLSLSISYQPGHEIGQMLAQLRQEGSREIKLGVTQYGPHRADLKVRTSERLAGSVLSRGQGKIAAIALRLAQARDLKDQRGIAPLFLIDDVGAELDTGHNERLFRYLQALDCQVLATTALDELPRMNNWTMNWRLFHVEQGCITTTAGTD